MSFEIEKPNDINQLCAIDISGVKDKVLKLSDKIWASENSRKENDFDCFHHTQHIVFKFITHREDHKAYHVNRSWYLWEPIFMPIMDQVAEYYGFRNAVFPKAMLARLEAGYEIDPHRDLAEPNRFTHKIHVPISTNPEVRFFIDDRAYELSEGFAYEVNNLKKHAVQNFGDQHRVHFIFEVFNQAD